MGGHGGQGGRRGCRSDDRGRVPRRRRANNPGNGHPDSAHLWLPSQDARELLDNELETPEFDLPGLIAPGVLTALGGYTGAGKTPTVADLIRSMLQGNEFCGIPMQRPLPPDYKFLFMTQESEHTFKPTLHRMGLDPVLRTGQMEIVYLHKVLAKAPEATWDHIVDGAYAKFDRPRGLLIVDPLSDWSMVKNEDDNAVMAKAFRPLVGVVRHGAVRLGRRARLEVLRLDQGRGRLHDAHPGRWRNRLQLLADLDLQTPDAETGGPGRPVYEAGQATARRSDGGSLRSP